MNASEPAHETAPVRNGRSARGRVGRWAFFAIVVGATLLFVRLGFWQLHRLAERRAENATIRARRALPPLVVPGGVEAALLLSTRPVGAAAPITASGSGRAGAAADSLGWRSAVLVGRFDWGREIVLRDRSYRGAPGVYVVTPLLVRMGRDSVAIPVLRGWIPAPDAFHAPLLAARPDSAARSGGIEARLDSVRVLVLPALAVRARNVAQLAAADGPHPVLGHLDLSALDTLLPYPITGVYAQRIDSAGPGPFPIRIGEPDPSSGPFLSYALQWFAFALISVVGGLIFWRRGGVG